MEEEIVHIDSQSGNDKSGTLQSIEKFIDWLKTNTYFSYDQYDFWSTRYGITAKRIYYKNKFIGIPFVAVIFLAEIFYPKSRKAFVTKKRFPIADAHFILGFLNLYEVTLKKEYLEEAQKIASELLKSSVPGFSGYCWGYPFDWMTTRGLWTSGVPLITTTGYCFEAFLKLYDITNDQKYFDIAQSIFVEGAKRFDNLEALKKANLNINFILKNQNKDGSWKYAINDDRDNFVDHFHTCFVLKNLYKANLILKDDRVSQAITKGFYFYKKYLFDESGSPIPFAKLSRLNIVKRELYDYAEGISLCLLMRSSYPDAKQLADHMISEVIHSYQNKNGSFFTNINVFNIRNKIPYLRWPQSQLFFALTNYLKN